MTHRIDPETAARLDRLLKGEDLTPGQQIALLKMLNTDLARQVVATLERSSTARSGYADFLALEAKDYARKKMNGYHALTPVKGAMIANRVAVRLATELGIPLPSRRGPDFRARSRAYTPGARADRSFNPW